MIFDPDFLLNRAAVGATYLLRGALVFLVLALIARLMAWMTWRIITSQARISRQRMTASREKTLRALLSSLMDGLAVILTLVTVLGFFIPSSALITALGLFSAGIGFGARPFISDFLGGIVLIFEDQFVIGDKVEMGDRNVIGTVERVSLRTTIIRGELGEYWIVPNGDVRTIRNFTRGNFSAAGLRLTVPINQLTAAMNILHTICDDPGPDVVARPEIISETGDLGTHTTLFLRVKARHGQGPKVRRRLLARVQIALAEAGIQI
jgi:small conductance mechanosensitive channel